MLPLVPLSELNKFIVIWEILSSAMTCNAHSVFSGFEMCTSAWMHVSKFVYVQMFCEMEQCVAAFRHFIWPKLSRTHVGQRYCHCLSLFPLPSLCPLSCFATPTSLSLSLCLSISLPLPLPLLWKSRTAHISEPMKSSGGGKTQKEISKWDV